MLNLRSGEAAPRAWLPVIEPGRPYEATLELIMEALQTVTRRLPDSESPLWLSLSAGLDSRVMLTAAQSSGRLYQPFTYVSPRMSAADRLIPARLASRLGRKLLLMPPGLGTRARQRRRWEIVDKHSGHHVSVGDAQPLLRGSRDRMHGVSTGGWGFGVGKALERDRLPDSLLSTRDEAVDLARRLDEPPDSPAVSALEEWLAWVAETPRQHVDWRDRYHLEQRLAGWQSSKEQVYDLQRVERFPTVNAARIYALLLGLDERDRTERRHMSELVERMRPELAGILVNPPVRSLGQLRVVGVRLRDDPAGLPRRAIKTMRSNR